MLYLAERLGLTVAEVPVRWYDAPGSTVRPLQEAVRFLAEEDHAKAHHPLSEADAKKIGAW